MKKLVAISVAAAMLLGLATVAMATQATDWTMLLKASDANWQNAAGLIQIGTKTGALDTKDSNDTKYTANNGSQAQVVSYEPTFSDVPPFYSTDKAAPLAWTGDSKTFNLLVWAGSGYSMPSINLAWYSTSTLTPTVATGYAITLSVVNDPTGTFAAGKSWTWVPNATGTSTAPAQTITFNNISSVKIADASAVNQGIQLQMTVAPTAPVPEPSSMLALASGLAGLAGFAIRRRSA